MKIKILYILSLLAVLLTACTTSETKKDNQIDPQIKNEIRAVNTKILNGFIDNKPEIVMAMSSFRLLQRKLEIRRLMQLLNGRLKKKDFKILNEYYQKNASKKGIAEVSSGTTGIHDYQIRYEALNNEMYVVVGYFRDTTDNKCFTLIYGKDGNEWKLNNINVGILKLRSKDAIDWYLSAKSNYEKGNLIDALCNINLSTQILKPANQMWHYNKEKDITALEQKILKQTYTKYHFPMTVESVETKPVIFRVYPESLSEGYFPLILYTTSVDIKDVRKLSKECNELHDNIEKLFKGITTNNKMILYRPLKRIPDGNDTRKYPGFMQMTKK